MIMPIGHYMDIIPTFNHNRSGGGTFHSDGIKVHQNEVSIKYYRKDGLQYFNKY